MQNFELTLTADACDSFRCQKAANSLDINVAEKLSHHFKVSADIETKYNVGVIVGASGAGKTTLARHIWGDELLQRRLDNDVPVIDQFPKDMEYKECVRLLTGVGLTSVPCWIRPSYTLSNGQKERAEIALTMAQNDDFAVIDEWTSVVDRTVGKIMSHCIAKWARKTKRRVVLLTCHYDVLDWLQPDWVIDCNKQEYVDRRLLQPSRKEKIKFDIRECGRGSWKHFAKYHYLSKRLPGGHIKTFGLYYGDDQIGFQCFANYVPYRKTDKKKGGRMKMHSNRTVVHPDYVGLGLGMMLIDETSQIMWERNYNVMAKFSSQPVFVAMSRNERWKFTGKYTDHKVVLGRNMIRDSGFRIDVTSYSFKYIPVTNNVH